ncbi:hypothetical protein M378DRAFT_156375 [Amanita muscaria Koide BX008]|uniref:Ribosome maturation protein SDO1/SBDS N-terminal domain-containing protein n=1 Tax=Amanita muscaria (strain Koide BX008) TaxID=946122 RepID=A0A0C2TSK3_AMAMK|nr:hypothetical protein M378DRAFT_156375 [Amanita muscaria Koide BX008]
MVNHISRVVYKPDHEKPDEFIVIINPPEYKKWKEGDKSIPLAEVLDSFEIFHSNQGSQGILGRPSKQQLDTYFGTNDDTKVITTILQKGREHSSDGIRAGSGATNLARGSFSIDNKGRGNVVGGI